MRITSPLIRTGLKSARCRMVAPSALCAAIALSFSTAFSTTAGPGPDTKKPEVSLESQIRFKVDKYKLPNGLTVLLHEDHSVPIVSYQSWFRVGSKNEEVGFTGIAHLFEHLMFKGAKRYNEGQFETILQANGAVNNAFTTHDYTGYYENLPAGKLELVIDIEADRMENLQITEAHLAAEREVVKEERRFRVDNNPMGMLREAMFSTSYKVHPYRWPVIGHMQDLNNITLAKAREFFKTYYSPNNAVIVVAGDFKSEQVKKWIDKYYGHLKSQQLPAAKVLPEPPQTQVREQVVTMDLQSVTFSRGFHSVKAGVDEAYALDLLASILGNGEASRLHKRLVYRDQVATSAWAYNYTPQDNGVFQVGAALKPNGNLAAAQKAVAGEVWKVQNQLVSDNELEMAKNKTMKGYIDSLKTVHGKAEALALNEIYFNDYEQLFKDLERYNKVTKEQLLDVAKKYLKTNQSSVVVLKPRKKGNG